MTTLDRSPRNAFLFLLPVLLSSCGEYYYMANAVNVPLSREKGEICASGLGGSARRNTASGPAASNTALEAGSVEFQAAYALSHHWAVMANTARFTHGRDVGRLWEAGAGYHARTDKHLVTEVYAGCGIGRLALNERPVHATTITMIRGFVQPNIGYASRNFEMALSARICPLWYSGFEKNTGDPEDPNSGIPASCRVLVEPAFTLRAGFRGAKLQLQWCATQNLGRQFPMVDRTFSLGLYLNINNAFKKTKAAHP